MESPVRIFIRNLHRDPVPMPWEKPQIGWTKLNFDGSCEDSAGKDSFGGVFRNHEAEFILCYAESIGRTTMVIAELAALQRGLELVLENGWSNVWLEGDSKSLVDINVENKLVSVRKHRQVSYLNLIIPQLKNCLVNHVFREVAVS